MASCRCHGTMGCCFVDFELGARCLQMDLHMIARVSWLSCQKGSVMLQMGSIVATPAELVVEYQDLVSPLLSSISIGNNWNA